MALFLDDSLRSTASNPLPDSLVHSYSKKPFNDAFTAELTLMNKVLLPGEVAFAYYNDPLSPYGQSAIFAVGPLTHGAGNIIYKNAIMIDEIVNNFDETVADVNASINYLRHDLENMVNDFIDYVDASVNILWENTQGPLNVYKTNIDDLSTRLKETEHKLQNNINASFVELKNEIKAADTDLKLLINNVSVNLGDSILNAQDNANNSIIQVRNEISIVEANLESLISKVSLDLSNSSLRLLNNINTSYIELKNKIDTGDTNLKLMITDVSTKLTNKIEDKALYIISYVTNLFAESLGSSKEDTEEKINDSAVNLQDIINNFKEELLNTITSTNDAQNSSIYDLYNKIKDLEYKYNVDHEILKELNHLYLEKDGEYGHVIERLFTIRKDFYTDTDTNINKIQSLIKEIQDLLAIILAKIK